ncbi:MAG: phosphoribosylamine--glycine ligase [Alphaproteobacteria bacterium]|nr:phosphoribosylamine--glycine ligase [Alphaproteobacteria bacterium]
MDVLLVGSGAREHALAWKLRQSPLLGRLYCAPGNAGIAAVAECVAIGAEDLDGLVEFARTARVDFVLVGPEAPLVGGLADRMAAAGILALGPGADAAQLEGSKGFVKDLCRSHNIPTAAYERFRAPTPAKAYAAQLGYPVVIKADGLAAGKGVVIAANAAEADAAIEAMFDGAFGAAGQQIVVEEFLDGEELSFFVLSDGRQALFLGAAQDHKRVGDGDVGPNTGGMGAYSPTPLITPKLQDEIMGLIVHPTIAAMAAAGTPYRGVLFAGLMLTDEGPKLIEFNCRFGDPECQVLMLRLTSDLLPALVAAARGDLKGMTLKWSPEVALTVVMAAKGYPGAYAKGTVIRGLDRQGGLPDALVFHAATSKDGDQLVANGGRVLSVSARGKSVHEAQARAYAAVDRIDWPQGFCRRDIGWRAVARERVRD